MTTAKPGQQDIQKGYQECLDCGGILLMEAGFEVATSACVQCGKHVASREEFFSVGGEILSK